MTHTCKKHGDASTAAAKCKECKRLSNAAQRAKSTGGGKPVSRPKVTALAEISAKPPLVIPAGHGIEATVREGYLSLTQADDEVLLSKAEARAVFERFKEWLAC